jgi:hypothetical protein
LLLLLLVDKSLVSASYYYDCNNYYCFYMHILSVIIIYVYFFFFFGCYTYGYTADLYCACDVGSIDVILVFNGFLIVGDEFIINSLLNKILSVKFNDYDS